jgi:hypothetical protein
MFTREKLWTHDCDYSPSWPGSPCASGTLIVVESQVRRRERCCGFLKRGVAENKKILVQKDA